VRYAAGKRTSFEGVAKPFLWCTRRGHGAAGYGHPAACQHRDCPPGMKRWSICLAREADGSTRPRNVSGLVRTRLPPCGTAGVTLGYDRLGRVTAVTDGDGNKTLAYNAQDQVTVTGVIH
jgi:YD repeat-containing protein